ncbi:hypothetical protein BDN71DRAFT_1453306 [Pleurotus eryngii]|uniref:Uncharacterized protein n=1 Tax=Pleurotus eryngii TaxID=5323 RepID=A0A9P5ZPS1_PLEER|nr:hypothetical protein BDN71DRAFT_1453306 [Pleurotus eryngii]
MFISPTPCPQFVAPAQDPGVSPPRSFVWFDGRLIPSLLRAAFCILIMMYPAYLEARKHLGHGDRVH